MCAWGSEGWVGGAYEISRHDLVDGALVGDEGVVEHAGEADHGKATVLDLGVLHMCTTTGYTQRIPTWVWIGAHASHAALHGEHRMRAGYPCPHAP